MTKNMAKRLENKVCIITGSANGIGFATAQKFCDEGGISIICDMNEAQVQKAVDQLKAAGGQADVFGRLRDRAVAAAPGAQRDHFKKRFGQAGSVGQVNRCVAQIVALHKSHARLLFELGFGIGHTAQHFGRCNPLPIRDQNDIGLGPFRFFQTIHHQVHGIHI